MIFEKTKGDGREKMLVVGSSAMPKKDRVYHKIDCKYAKRIRLDNVIKMSPEVAKKRHFHECKYCGGMKGDIKTHSKKIEFWEKKNDLKLTFLESKNTLYIQTKIGFWKIYKKDENEKYRLYHRNSYEKDMSFDKASHGEFHRQGDVKLTGTLEKIVNYVVAHDKAKAIINDDYHKLPQKTKKQKMYYKKAERRAKAQTVRRVEMILDML